MQTVVGSTINFDADLSLFEEINLAIWEMNLLYEGIRDRKLFFVRLRKTEDPERIGRFITSKLMDMNNPYINELLNDTAIVIMDPEKCISRSEVFSLLIEPVFQETID